MLWKIKIWTLTVNLCSHSKWCSQVCNNRKIWILCRGMAPPLALWWPYTSLHTGHWRQGSMAGWPKPWWLSWNTECEWSYEKQKFSSISHPPSYFAGGSHGAVSHPPAYLAGSCQETVLNCLPTSREAGTFYFTLPRYSCESYNMEFVPPLQWPTTCEVCHLAPPVRCHPVGCGELAHTRLAYI